jgi:hypothetical protein
MQGVVIRIPSPTARPELFFEDGPCRFQVLGIDQDGLILIVRESSAETRGKSFLLEHYQTAVREGSEAEEASPVAIGRERYRSHVSPVEFKYGKPQVLDLSNPYPSACHFDGLRRTEVAGSLAFPAKHAQKLPVPPEDLDLAGPIVRDINATCGVDGQSTRILEKKALGQLGVCDPNLLDEPHSTRLVEVCKTAVLPAEDGGGYSKN